ncbi:MAG TPA: DUF2142 domain-containing protein [Aggregatilineales bacterium]|nr:DUF2142 domain-containing protein [Aggregatilineales bacterium]
MIRRIELPLLLVILIAYLAIAALYAVRTPDWEVPDEPAHYNYAAQVAANGCCPTLQAGDWNSDYLDKIKAAKFASVALNGQIGTVRYEDHQPPAYYLLQAVVYRVSGGKLHALRLFSALLGAGVIIMAWAVVRTAFPVQPWLALTTAGFVAFLPQHIAMMAGVENDSLAELLAGAILLACVLYVGNGTRRPHPALLGLLVGLGFLTKVTIYPLVAIAGLAIVLRARQERWSFGRFARDLALMLIPALLLGAIWWGHSVAVYGWPDFLGLRIHDSVVVGQLRTSQRIADVGFGRWLTDGLITTFNSFWGQFGWMGVPMPGLFYNLLLAFSLVVIVGAGIAFARYRKAITLPQRDALILLAVVGLAALAEISYYNLTFVQFQGRYLYPGLIAIALAVAVGLAGWASLLASRVPAIRWLPVVIMFAFAALDVYALYKFILPQLALS